MGCGGSKVDDLPLVTLCRERKELLKAAADHRYALATSHILYFKSLKDVGDALRRFVDEELVIDVTSSSVSSESPVFTLHSDETLPKNTKKNQKKKKTNNDKTASKISSSSSSSSLSHSSSLTHHHHHDHHHSPVHDSHLHLTSSDSDSDSKLSSGHIHISSDSPESEKEPDSSPPVFFNSSPPGLNSYTYYMKKSSSAIPSVVYQDSNMSPGTAQWSDTSYMYSGYPQYGGMGGGGYFGIPMGGSDLPQDPFYRSYAQPSPPRPAAPPSPPPPPQYSTWDFLNPFDLGENEYPTYYPTGIYGVGSISSSPDSAEVRHREGIPDLEDETEQGPPLKELRKDKQKIEENLRLGDFGEGTSKSVPLHNENKGSVLEKEIKSSSESSISEIAEDVVEEIPRKKGVSFEVGTTQSAENGESSRLSSLSTLPPQGTRDLKEAVKEIRDEFEVASDYGKEVAVMLEVGKLPYQARTTVFRVISSRILSLIAPSVSHPPPRQSTFVAANVMKMAKAKYGYSTDFVMRSGNLSLTLERLYAWEKKLYKEVKDEEKLRVIYEKKCKRLKVLDVRGAESNKIEATQASIRKLLTKINVAIKTVDAIASRIHKLRDEELQPQITELINGLIRMWKSMLKCHQKQFQAIIDSKSRTLKVNTSMQGDSSLRATVDLEWELRNWSTHFNDWICSQKAYIESLNGWLLRCLHQEQEETADGIMPFSPSRVGAPPVFIVCNDWYHAMERLSESKVVETMQAFALTLHQLWERQIEEQRQRVKAEYISKDFEKRLRYLRKEEGRMQRDHDAASDKSAKSIVPTESGVSPLDDLKVDLDSMRKRLEEERTKYKETVKRVNDASNSLQAGLIPIFESLENFTSEMLNAYEHVRIQNDGGT